MAIFKRRKPRSVGRKIRESLWPSMGWMRTWHYYNHRLFRGGDSTHKITAGMAFGVAFSHTPFLGTHIVQAVLFSLIFRVNALASVVGTLWGNPWTFPFIFWLSYRLGILICGMFGLHSFVELPEDVDLTYLFAHPVTLLLPMVIGGYLSAIIVWPLAYGLLYYPVLRLQRAYRRQKLKRAFRKARGKKSGGAG